MSQRRSTPRDHRGDTRTRPSAVMESATRLVFHAVLLTSVFFLVAGHNAPGGGFIGGLVAGSAFVLHYVASGGDRPLVRMRPATVLGAGLTLAVLTAMVPWLFGGQILESDITYLELPVLGELPLASVLAFDTGVFLVVVGIVLGVLSSLGAQPDASLGGRVPATGEGDL